MNVTEIAARKNEKFLHGEHILMRLTYVSRFNNHNDHDELEKILEQARANNRERGITGVLVFNHNYFLQSIEGRRPIINDLLRKLVKDQRHFSLQIIDCREIDQRRWSQWSMNYLTPTDRHRNEALRFSGEATFNPYLMNTKQIMMLLESLTKMMETEPAPAPGRSAPAPQKRRWFGLGRAA